MAFYLSDAYSQMDWSLGNTFLDQELRAVTRVQKMANALGTRFIKNPTIAGVFIGCVVIKV